MYNEQLRVVIEKAELDIKRNDLDQHLLKSVRNGISILPTEELLRMKHQVDVMAQYSEVLGDRLANFPEKMVGFG